MKTLSEDCRRCLNFKPCTVSTSEVFGDKFVQVFRKVEKNDAHLEKKTEFITKISLRAVISDWLTQLGQCWKYCVHPSETKVRRVVCGVPSGFIPSHSVEYMIRIMSLCIRKWRIYIYNTVCVCVCVRASVLRVSITFLIFVSVRHDAVKTTTTTVIVISVPCVGQKYCHSRIYCFIFFFGTIFICLFLLRGGFRIIRINTKTSDRCMSGEVISSIHNNTYASVNARILRTTIHAVRCRQ